VLALATPGVASAGGRPAGVPPAAAGFLVTAAPDTAVTGPAAAGATAAESVATAARDTAAVRARLAPAPERARRTLPRPGRFDQPRWVMLRSLLVPGWGQAHNRAWIKAVLVAAGDGALRVRFFRDERRLSDLDGEATGRQRELEAADQTLAAAQAELAAAQAEDPPNPARIAAAEAALLAANQARAGASDAYNGAVLAYNALLDTSISRRWLMGGVVLYALIDAYVDAHFKRFDINLEFDPALPGGTSGPGARLQIRWAF
jgi:hypothetical protein